jgi:hypothetical protein
MAAVRDKTAVEHKRRDRRFRPTADLGATRSEGRLRAQTARCCVMLNRLLYDDISRRLLINYFNKSIMANDAQHFGNRRLNAVVRGYFSSHVGSGIAVGRFL